MVANEVAPILKELMKILKISDTSAFDFSIPVLCFNRLQNSFIGPNGCKRSSPNIERIDENFKNVRKIKIGCSMPMQRFKRPENSLSLPKNCKRISTHIERIY